MYSMIIGVLKAGVKDSLDRYYSHPFDLFEAYYELSDLYRTPHEWFPILGERKQMDWGSWLSICSFNEIQELIKIKPSRLKRIIPTSDEGTSAQKGTIQPFTELPKSDWYGILEVEDY